MRKLIRGAAAAVLLAGCAASEDASAQAERLAASVEGSRVIPITQANDELGLYDAARPPTSVAVIHMPGMACEKVNFHACGATVEVSTDGHESVLRTSKLTVAMLKDGGTQDVWIWVKDSSTLTVSSDLPAVDRSLLAAAVDGEPAF